jgi:hypothetical protein
MNKIFAASLLAGSFALAPGAFAQEGAVSGAAGGAVTGAVVGGPVGAVVGGVAGAAVGTILDPPPSEVRTVVVQQTTPSVVYQQPVVVGQPLPTTVVLYPVPGYENYYYTVVNNERVIVDPQSRTVLQVVN